MASVTRLAPYGTTRLRGAASVVAALSLAAAIGATEFFGAQTQTATES